MLAQTNALEYVNIYASVLFLTSTPKSLHIIYTIKKITMLITNIVDTCTLLVVINFAITFQFAVSNSYIRHCSRIFIGY